ncbi:MAG: PilZ domain-containing protein [Thiobacillaceae bacterium]
MVTNERCRRPRFPYHWKGHLSCPTMNYRGTLIDISLFAALFDARFPRDAVLGTRCELQVLNLNESCLLKVEGVIAHSEQNLVGIEFLSIDEECRNKILHIAVLNLAPPHLIERALVWLGWCYRLSSATVKKPGWRGQRQHLLSFSIDRHRKHSPTHTAQRR